MKRLLSGLVLGALLVITIWSANPYFFIAFGTLVMSLALWEFYSLAQMVGCNCYKFLGYCASAVVVYGFIINKQILILPASVALLISMMIAVLFESKDAKDFPKIVGSVSATLFGTFYVFVLPAYLIATRMIVSPVEGLASRLLTIFFLIIVAGDAGAYYAGRSLGKHKLAPVISPGKTVEGSVGGLIAAIVIALVAKYTFFPQIPVLHAVILSIVMNIVGQMGDLFESLIKRGSGAKDAASIIPGHGGLLDRLDSVVFNAPLLYLYYLIQFAK